MYLSHFISILTQTTIAKLMKKVLLTICFVIIATTGFSQIQQGESAFAAQTGFRTETTRLLVGARWQKALFDNIRFSGEFNYLFPKNKTMGVDLETNFHYIFSIDAEEEKMYVYPILGASMVNDRYMGEKVGGHIVKKSDGWTNFGVNIGCGYEYHLSEALFANTEMKYTFGQFDAFAWTIGLGFRY